MSITGMKPVSEPIQQEESIPEESRGRARVINKNKIKSKRQPSKKKER